MVNQERQALVAPCGIDCGNCELYTCRVNPAMLEFLVKKGMPADKIPCSGCRSINGLCPVLKGHCETHACASKKGVSFCHECGEFPCRKLLPAADRAGVLPHNLKLFCLCTIKNRGIDALITEYPEMKRNYFQGKMVVGSGPTAQ